MNLVADEGVDKPIVDALRAARFNVVYFAEVFSGIADAAVLSAASEAESLLLTCDKDFGELVYRKRLSTAGVVLIRLSGLSQESKAQMVTQALKEHGREMRNAFTVIAPGLLRIRGRLNP